MKNESTFYSKRIVETIRHNVENSEWARKVKDDIVEKARYWVGLSDEELWGMMFGNTIKRSWSVWSDGYCPSCGKDAVMYSWKADPVNKPWKLQCPNCGELFPKNDFYKYYKTGLDESGLFNYDLADKSLLYNEEHADKADPLYKFGVDDSNGYTDGKNTWRFIGAYLIYGQWKRLILAGVNNLSAAYVVTGKGVYAHKAGILFDRIADLYPTFDFAKDGILYEGKNVCPGYVSYSVDACVESKELIIAYDRIFDGIKQDKSLEDFLTGKARSFKGILPKNSFEDIQKNIETNILQHVLDNPKKTNCNYPNTDAAYAIAKMVISWNENRKDILQFIKNIVARSTAVDGVTGEKGLATYSAWTIRVLAEFLGICCLADDGFLKDIFREYPQIYKTYRFHIDTWCLNKYYPLVGDTGNFAKIFEHYLGLTLDKNPGIDPSMFTFLWKLYELTADTDFLKLMYKHNENSVQNLPYDLTVENPVHIHKTVQEAIEREGGELVHVSTNKEEWGIAVLASGRGEDSRAVWIHYDTLRDHSHIDAMNLGLYGKGLNLMPDFGYPPVQYGGWYTPQAYWYSNTASHNTVMVDCENQKKIEGYKPKANFWCTGNGFKAIRVSEPRFVNGKQYERTIALIDISEKDSYILDIFRVAGGKEHVKFMHSGMSALTVKGLELEKTGDFDQYGIMKNFYTDMKPAIGWSADWKLQEDSMPAGGTGNIHLNYTDITRNAEAYTAEAWVALDGYTSRSEIWIPRLMQRRECKGEGLLQTAFAGIIEPYSVESKIASIKRLEMSYNNGQCANDSDIAVQIDHTDGKSDLLISVDVEDPQEYKKNTAGLRIIQEEWGICTDCQLLMVRKDRNRKTERISICKGSFLSIGGRNIEFEKDGDFKEIILSF